MSFKNGAKIRPRFVPCPVCAVQVAEDAINDHLDSSACKLDSTQDTVPSSSQSSTATKVGVKTPAKKPLAPIFSSAKREREPPVPSSTFKSTQQRAVIDVDSDQQQPPAKRQKTTAENLQAAQPLAARLRPTTLAEFVGQQHIVGSDSLLLSNSTGSVILWGPPGCGKTTLARLLAQDSGATFKELSATSSGAAEARSVCEEAKGALKMKGRRTVLFLDEIHRFNKAQQDVFLPYVEAGHIRLIGATTENPSFKVNGALISRCRVFVLERLTSEDVTTILSRALERHNSALSSADTTPPPEPIVMSDPVRDTIVALASGDARTALSLLELVITSLSQTPARRPTEANLIHHLKRSVATSYDRTGDDRYDLISALHKSVRGSDGSAALYWLARMLTAGEDPLYIARRLIVMASEDIGLADDACLSLAIATHTACQTVGMPECRINLAHCVARFAEARKSTRSYEAYNRAEEVAKKDPGAPVPMHLRNAPTGLMKGLGYGKEYKYNPAFAHPVFQEYLPVEALENAGVEESEREFLRKDEAEAKKDKVWNNSMLEQWEWFKNGGQAWEGRPLEEK
ncbi:P-loop containing nucleoside triphosphate hydrolase protein [Exidia glandulosa HHB12029]|uniref:p-loop containing nucleoside triphosphate hydrolase protein n=1 Tax=Exidia glandulosa HHB12029 TaxID=1314781 RepID=A0A165NUM7_EXIGL|nr:P-loop containing nucleoside triphosphate hydrolase protein [Exidia glandulosa HHB12029]